MTSENPLVTLIVPCYNGENYLKPCINSILNGSYQNVEIIIVDDASTDKSWEVMNSFTDPRIRLLQHKKNKGYTYACNYAFKNMKGDFLILVNVDMTFAKTAVERLVHAILLDKSIGAVIPMLGHKGVRERDRSYMKKRIIPQYSIVGGYGIVPMKSLKIKKKTYPRIIDYFYTGVLIIRRSAITHLFKEIYLCYGEDVELCWRLRADGYQVLLHLDAHGHHVGGSALKERKMSDRAVLHGTKNRVMNFFIFYQMATLLRVLPLLFINELTIFFGQPGRIPLRLKSYWWILTHLGMVYKWRKEVQSKRTTKDNVILESMSYKFNEPSLVKSTFVGVVYRILNVIAYVYTKIVFLKTVDN